MKYSKNKKLNSALCGIREDLERIGENEICRYMKQFKTEPDYNLAQYGNLLCYTNQIYDFYKNCGYKSLSAWGWDKIWALYLRQVGFVARSLVK